MRRVSLTAAVLLATTSIATAGGIDRSGQGVNILFEEGDYVQFTFSGANPDVDGTGVGGFAGSNASDVLPGYNGYSMGYKHEISDTLDFALIMDEPYGAHVLYTDGPLSAGGAAGLPYNGTADVTSSALTGLLRYKFDNGFSVYGGARGVSLDGLIESGGGGLKASSDFDFGGVAGVAYERPEIALRVALTYASEISADLSGTYRTPFEVATGGAGVATSTTIDLPESINLDFQTGVAKDTLVFGSIRWVGWDGVALSSNGVDWVDWDEDTITYTLGVGRQVTENLSLALTLGYETGGDVPTDSALAPTNGFKSIGFGGTYQATEQLAISGGITYVDLGDQTYQGVNGAPGAADIDFSGDAWGAGIRIGYRF